MAIEEVGIQTSLERMPGALCLLTEPFKQEFSIEIPDKAADAIHSGM